MLKKATTVIAMGMLVVLSTSAQARDLAVHRVMTGCTNNSTSLLRHVRHYVGRDRAAVLVSLTGFYLQTVDGGDNCRGKRIGDLSGEDNEVAVVSVRIKNVVYDRTTGFVTFAVLANMADTWEIPWDPSKTFYDIAYSYLATDL